MQRKYLVTIDGYSLKAPLETMLTAQEIFNASAISYMTGEWFDKILLDNVECELCRKNWFMSIRNKETGEVYDRNY